MKISVAMATYNGASYIEKQLDSIRNQFLMPDEVIIFDDASTDGTADIIKAYIEKYSLFGWALYENETNLGFKKNFFNAISKTSGKFIFLCDQDDIWLPEKTQEMCWVLEQNKNILSLCSSFSFIDNEDKPLTVPNPLGLANNGLIPLKNSKDILNSINLKTVLHSNISPGCTTAIRKELKESFLKNSNSVLAHDWELNLVAAANNGLFFYNKPLSLYRIHSSNALGLDSAAKGRVNIAKEKKAATETLCRYFNYTNLLKMQKERVEFLKNKKPLKALKMFLSNSSYARYYSFKERIGDIRYCLKKS